MSSRHGHMYPRSYLSWLRDWYKNLNLDASGSPLAIPQQNYLSNMLFRLFNIFITAAAIMIMLARPALSQITMVSASLGATLDFALHLLTFIAGYDG